MVAGGPRVDRVYLNNIKAGTGGQWDSQIKYIKFQVSEQSKAKDKLLVKFKYINYDFFLGKQHLS